jgi:hypothetical protein
MRSFLMSATAVVFLAVTSSASQAEVKQVSYPLVRVKLAPAFSPDDTFVKMQTAFAAAVSAKDAQALFSLVGPTFLWMSRGELNDQFNFGNAPLDNFKALFGFSQSGENTSSAAAEGPLWDVLATFAADKAFYVATGTLVCGPSSAVLADEDDFNSAKRKIGADASIEWYYTLADTPVTSSPIDAGPPLGHINQSAVPVLNVFPPPTAGQPKSPVTHLQVLLPSGKTGWIPLAAGLPLVTDRLCYAVTADGDWKIAAFDQAE